MANAVCPVAPLLQSVSISRFSIRPQRALPSLSTSTMWGCRSMHILVHVETGRLSGTKYSRRAYMRIILQARKWRNRSDIASVDTYKWRGRELFVTYGGEMALLEPTGEPPQPLAGPQSTMVGCPHDVYCGSFLRCRLACRLNLLTPPASITNKDKASLTYYFPRTGLCFCINSQKTLEVASAVGCPSAGCDSLKVNCFCLTDYQGFEFGDEDTRKFTITARIPHEGESNRYCFCGLFRRPSVDLNCGIST